MRDDLVPEEREQEYARLLTVLRSAAQERVPIPAEEQRQNISVGKCSRMFGVL
jgi:hypothetical protein